ncbi:MAG: DUF2189 domain-containing protein [Caulobacterales bacterium]|nr:DUF2189 domain-containing protein [Caulobacterales bacterium]
MVTDAAHADVVDEIDHVAIRSITMADLRAALREGWEDFRAVPTHLFFILLIYPIGALLGLWVANNQTVAPLAFPIVSGFALLGPFAAVVLYEISRRREQGLAPKWWHGFRAFGSASAPAIAILGLGLTALFSLWILLALVIYRATLGDAPPASFAALIGQTFSTPDGMTMLIIGNAVGFVFAVVVFASNMVSFPMLVDRHVHPFTAMVTSLRVFAKSPATSLAWAVIIVALLLAGTATLLVGLAVVAPVLGHASWRLYRRAVG